MNTYLKTFLIFSTFLMIVGCSPFISYTGKDGRIEYSTKKIKTSKADKKAWKKATDLNSIDSYVTYLNKYPSGKFADKANEIIEFVEKKFKVKVSRDPSNIHFASEKDPPQAEILFASQTNGKADLFPDKMTDVFLEAIRQDYSKIDLSFFYKNIPSDTDADGIFDIFDNCANTPPYVITDVFGCKILADEDGDGISDDEDKCPMLAGSAKNDGCPAFNFMGQIIDENGEGIPGVSVVIGGTAIGAITDFDGNFMFNDLSEGSYNLMLNYTGYNNTNFPIQVGLGKNSETFKLDSDLTSTGMGSGNEDPEAELWEDFQKTKHTNSEIAEAIAKEYQREFKDGTHINEINAYLNSRLNPSTPVDSLTTPNNEYTTRSYDCSANLNARIGFSHMPDSLTVGEHFTFKVYLDDSSQVRRMVQMIIDEQDLNINIDDFKFVGRDTVGNIIFRDIKVAEFVSVELTGSPKEDFDIQPVHKNDKQKINCEFTPRWEWEITPKTEGEKLIKFVVQSYHGDETNIVMSKELPFAVSQKFQVIEPVDSVVTPTSPEPSPSFFQNPMAWVGMIGIIGMGIFAFLFFRKKNKEEGELAPLAAIGSSPSPANIVLPVLPNTGITKKKVFLSYAHEDEAWKEKLDNHLSALKRTEQIETWNDREIVGGEKWDEAIEAEMNVADIILFLISSDFLASEYIFDEELPLALERHNNKEAVVVPIFVRACDFKGLPFAELQGFPLNAKPIASFDENQQDEALAQVAAGIRAIVESGNVESA